MKLTKRILASVIATACAVSSFSLASLAADETAASGEMQRGLNATFYQTKGRIQGDRALANKISEITGWAVNAHNHGIEGSSTEYATIEEDDKRFDESMAVLKDITTEVESDLDTVDTIDGLSTVLGNGDNDDDFWAHLTGEIEIDEAEMYQFAGKVDNGLVIELTPKPEDAETEAQAEVEPIRVFEFWGNGSYSDWGLGIIDDAVPLEAGTYIIDAYYLEYWGGNNAEITVKKGEDGDFTSFDDDYQIKNASTDVYTMYGFAGDYNQITAKIPTVGGAQSNNFDETKKQYDATIDDIMTVVFEAGKTVVPTPTLENNLQPYAESVGCTGNNAILVDYDGYITATEDGTYQFGLKKVDNGVVVTIGEDDPDTEEVESKRVIEYWAKDAYVNNATKPFYDDDAPVVELKAGVPVKINIKYLELDGDEGLHIYTRKVDITENEGTDDGNTDDGNTDNGNTDNGNTDNGNTDNGNTDDGNTDDGNTDDGNTDDGNTDDGNTDDGNTDDGNTDDGNTDDGNTDDGNTDNGNTDNGNTDNGNTDDGNTDNGNTDNGNTDNGNTDNGNTDNGNTDNGNTDNGNTDNGNIDNGNTDNGNTDNGNTDNGNTDNNDGIDAQDLDVVVTPVEGTEKLIDDNFIFTVTDVVDLEAAKETLEAPTLDSPNTGDEVIFQGFLDLPEGTQNTGVKIDEETGIATFNDKGTNLVLPESITQQINASKKLIVEAVIKPENTPAEHGVLASIGTSKNETADVQTALMGLRQGWAVKAIGANDACPKNVLNYNTWATVKWVFDKTGTKIYVDGKEVVNVNTVVQLDKIEGQFHINNRSVTDWDDTGLIGQMADFRITIDDIDCAGVDSVVVDGVKATAGANNAYTVTVNAAKTHDVKVNTLNDNATYTYDAKTGKIVVTAVDGKTTANYTLKITEKAAPTVTPTTVAVSKVTLDKTKATVVLGKTLTLKATVAPTNATNKKVTWKSSNTKVATVSAAGKVTAKGFGTARITATVGGKTATCTITVKPGKVSKLAAKAKGKTLTITFKKGAKASATKLVIYRNNKKVKTVNTSKTKVTVKNLKAGKYTVKAYATKKVGKKTYTSDVVKTKKATKIK